MSTSSTRRPRHWPTAPRIPPPNGSSRNIRRGGFEVAVDLAPVEEVAERLRYIAKREGKPLGNIVEFDAFHYEHQMPGGMVSNLKSQLARRWESDRLPEVLEEAARVRCELGYPIIVSPFAQFVMTQAVLNVMGKERYATVPDEVRKYVLGYYGEIAGPIDPNLFDRIAKGAEPTSARPGDLLEPGIRKLRRERGPFVSDDDLLLAAFYPGREYDALKAAGPIKTDYPLASTPLVTLLKEIAQRRDIRSFHFIQQPRDPRHDNPAIITVAITGAVPRKADTPGRAGHAARTDRIPPTRPLKPAPRSRISMCAIRMRARVRTRSCSRRCRRAWSSIAPA